MNKFLIILISFLTFSCLKAQDNVRLIYDVGVGGTFIPTTSNFSSWGVAYRSNFHSALNAGAKAMYVWKNKTSTGLKLNMLSMGSNYSLLDSRLVIDNVHSYYIAPQIGSVFPWNERYLFDMSVGAGYMLYNSTGFIDNIAYKNYSHLLGLNADLSLSYLLKGNTSVGVMSSFYTSAFSKNIYRDIGGVKQQIESDKLNKLNLSKIDFSLFIRIHL